MLSSRILPRNATALVAGCPSVVTAAGAQRLAYTAIQRNLQRRTVAVLSKPSRCYYYNSERLCLRSQFAPASFGKVTGVRYKTSQAEPEKKKEDEGEEGEKQGKEKEEKEKTESEKEKEKEKEEKEEKSEPPPPPPPHGNKSPFAVFVETLQSELKQSQEWQESTKQLASGAQQFTESPAVRKAREALEKTSEVTGKAGAATGETLKKVGKAVGHGAAWTWDSSVVKAGRTVVRKTAEGVDTITKPVRETETFKKVSTNLKEAIDDGSSSRYGGYLEKEERRKLREARELKELKEGKKRDIVQENPDAGENITLHKDAAWKEQWREFRDNSKLMQRMFTLRKDLEESENPFVATFREVKEKFDNFFAENETGLVYRKLKEMDPTFQLESFLRELREYILPEVLDAYVTGNKAVLQNWLSAAQFSVYNEIIKEYTKAGLVSSGRILDIRGVDVMNARMLEPGDIPILLISFKTQEIHVYKDAKSGKLAVGMEDKVQQVTYVVGMTRVPEEVRNPETMGWRIIEMQKIARDWI